MQLTPDETTNFIDRFYAFQDGVIRRFEYTYRQRSRKADARVTLSVEQSQEYGLAGCHVQQAGSGIEAWCNIVLDFEDVTEFVWTEGGQVFQQVLLFDLHIRHMNNLVYVDFGGIENFVAKELTSDSDWIAAFQRSKVYIAARVVTWRMVPWQTEFPKEEVT